MTQPPSSRGPQGPHAGPGPAPGDPARPGAIFPLRRMSLGEVLGGGTAMLRHAPKAVLGVPLLAGLVTFLLLMLAQLLFPTPLASMQNQMMMSTWSDDQMLSAVLDAVPYYTATVVVGVLQHLLLSVGFALIVLPTMRAAWGWRTEFLQMLTLRRDRLGALIGNVVVLAVIGILLTVVAMAFALLIIIVTFGIGALLALPALALLGLWMTAGLMYAPMVVLVERRGPMEALGRSWSLSTGRRWATIGTLALVLLIVFVISMILGIVAGLISAVGAGASVSPGGVTEPGVGSTIGLAVSTLITALTQSLVVALVGSVVAVMYLDARHRREGLDVALMAAAEGAHDDGVAVPGSVEHLGRPPEPAAQSPGSVPGQPGAHAQPEAYGQSGHPGHPGPYGQPGPYGSHGQSGSYGRPGSSDPYGRPGPSGRPDGPDDGGPTRPQ